MAQPLFDAVLGWRREMLARVNKLSAESSVPTVLVVRKRVMLTISLDIPGWTHAASMSLALVWIACRMQPAC